MKMQTTFVAFAALCISTSAGAQAWKDIGKTSSGNVVSIDPRSIKHSNGQVSAVVRVVFDPPVKVQRGEWRSSVTTATFDCAKKHIAAKRNVYYSDVKSTKEVERKENKMPGFGTTLGGTLGRVSLEYVCALKK